MPVPVITPSFESWLDSRRGAPAHAMSAAPDAVFLDESARLRATDPLTEDP